MDVVNLPQNNDIYEKNYLVIIHRLLVDLIKYDDDIIIFILLFYVYIENYQHYFDGKLLCMMILLSLMDVVNLPQNNGLHE